MARKKEISDGYMAYSLTQETSAIEQNRSSRDGKKEDRKEGVTEVSMKLCLCFFGQDVILWSLSMKDINKNYFLNSINAGAIEWSTLKISTFYSADSVSRPHIISASNFRISYLWLLRVLTSCSMIF